MPLTIHGGSFGIVARMRRLPGLLCVLPLVAALTTAETASASSSSFSSAMQVASQARQVPLPVIEAITYVNTRWEWINTPQIDGGVGPMKITPSQIALATSLSGHSQAEITGDLAANLDAGAALLANSHTGGTDLATWQTAVAATQGPQVAQAVFTVLGTGASRTTSTGEAITLGPQAVSAPTSGAGGASVNDSAATVASPDYGPAAWVPADPSNYSFANREHDYPINLIVIHDIEGDSSTAIQLFQRPDFAASAHYVIGYDGSITQMVREHDIAWHAGNWDYNTRAIGIEHAGFASQNLYTTAEYNASAALAASICSRYGVPLDRNHVIAHAEVPDPDNPGQFGGVDHHTDPGPYWNWSYYMTQATSAAAGLPSPPHMGPDPVATMNSSTSATVTWQPAQTCRKPITGYTATRQPGNVVQSLPASATSATFNGLQAGTAYTFTVTAANPDGQDTLTAVWRCGAANMTVTPGSPQPAGTIVQVTGSAGGCPSPQYEFWTLAPGSTSTWQVVRGYSSNATFNWNTTGLAAGAYKISIWVKDATSHASYDAFVPGTAYTLNTPSCSSINASASPASPQLAGTAVTIAASTSGCPNPRYQFWIRAPGGGWTIAQAFSSDSTFTWNTGPPAGTYYWSVWVRDAGSSAAYDNYWPGTAYMLNSTNCTSANASASPASPQSAGTTVTITASASGCPNPRYEFWIQPPGGSWAIAKAYSSTASFTWNSTPPAGTYRYSVWVRDASSPAAYDTYFPGTVYTLTTTPCTGVTASAAPTSPQPSGTAITITANASGCTNPRYEFWILAPGGSWTIVQPYSSAASFAWMTSGLPAGTYRYSVWVRDASSSASYDLYVPGTIYNLT